MQAIGSIQHHAPPGTNETISIEYRLHLLCQ
jgi:hypothetical protein